MIYTDTVMALSGMDNPQQQAGWLLCHILGCDFSDLLAGNVSVDEQQRTQINVAIEKLIDGYPLQYLVGSTQFMALPFHVREGVLIPRNDTEILVEKARRYIGDQSLAVLDLCCGSGCIGISLAHYCKNACVTCSDISEDALELTRENAELNNVDIEIVKSDLFEQIENKFDVLISNPPYIERAEMAQLSPQVQCEPALALDGGEDGLTYYQKIADHCAKVLKPKNKVFLEIGYNQGESVSMLFPGSVVEKDYNGIDRVVVGEKHV